MSWLADFIYPSDRKRRDDQQANTEPRGSPIAGVPQANSDAPDRKMNSKFANQPFLVHRQWREKERFSSKAESTHRKNSESRDYSKETRGLGCYNLMKFLTYAVLLLIFAPKFFTGNWIWNYRGTMFRLLNNQITEHKYFSERMLAKYDGSDPSLPIYIAIEGNIYDVTAGAKTYGKGGSYNNMAGIDATRSFGTGCFKTHRTHDIRGLSDMEMKGIQHWIKFFDEHDVYRKVGKVIHPPIDPNSPIPPPCKTSSDTELKNYVTVATMSETYQECPAGATLISS